MDDDELLEQIRNEPIRSEESPAAEPAPAPAWESIARREPERKGIPPWLKVAAVFVMLGGGVAFLLSGTGASSAFIYSKLVDELMAEPDAWVGREVRVEGKLRQGSIVFVNEPTCEHTFVLEREGHALPVRFPRCTVPDTFRDDMPMDVVVQGKLQSSGTFLADQVIPRCPSKYEMQQMQQNGEAMPHEMPTSRQQS